LTFGLSFKDLLDGKKIEKPEFELVKKEFLMTYGPDEKDGARAIKREIPVNSVVAIHADFHGDKYSMYAYLQDLVKRGFLEEKNPFRIRGDKKNFYMVFLGDFTDRGPDGLEVLYTAMRLRAENPDRVELLRGNHEDLAANGSYGFTDEVKGGLFSGVYDSDAIKNLLNPIYDAMPSVFYLGVKNGKGIMDYVMLMHAGIEPRFDPNQLLGEKLGGKNNSQKIEKLDASWIQDVEIIKIIEEDAILRFFVPVDELKMQPSLTGFSWNDFIVGDNPRAQQARGGGTAAFGQYFTEKYLGLCKGDKYRVNAIIRAHQHSSGELPKLMVAHGGIHGLWLDDKKQFCIKESSGWKN
jgi:Calcineurin-like phosphoesterase.